MIAIGVAAMDDVDEEILAAMREALARNFPRPVMPLAPLGAAPGAWDPSRRQHSAPLVLKRLLAKAPKEVEKLVGVTESDLFIPMLTFVYGQAQLDGRVAAVSIARLRQEFYGLPADRELLLARARKEAVHETGHLYGLAHCTVDGCAMSLSTYVSQIDLKSDSLCRGCRVRIWERSR